ncbi:MAG: dihydroxy-acid dehydratase, partial [Planctomycetaceae bacterium]|nr:dihydroxy-acid dehydratase [Planctomycetaceae bacterium]
MAADTNWRSREWFETTELYGWTRQAALQGMGLEPDSFQDRPIIGIANSWSELTHCNAHLRDLAQSVKNGVWQAGGVPFEFPVMSLGEFNMRPTTMLFRNLMSMVVEESIRANPLDAVVLLGGCDKTTPALLMGAASADVPAILVTGGPQLSAHWRGETLGSCTDCRRYHTELRAGNISAEDWGELQGVMVRSAGHCMTIGTASTMATLGESL